MNTKLISKTLVSVALKDSKALLLDYLASVREPERAASLFADDGVFELPFLRSLGVEPRYTGRREITALLNQLLKSNLVVFFTIFEHFSGFLWLNRGLLAHFMLIIQPGTHFKVECASPPPE